MKHIRLVCWLSFTLGAALSPALAAPASTRQVESRITAVTLYPEQARVTREAVVELPAGESVVEFTGLPEGLDEDSVQVSGKAAPGVTILNYEIRQVFGAEAQGEAARAVKEQLKPLEAQEKELGDNISILTEREGFLNDVRRQLAGAPDGPIPYAGGPTPVTPTDKLETIKGGYALYSSELAGIRANRRELQRQLEDLRPKLEQVRNELERLSNQTAPDTYKVVLALRSPTPSQGSRLQVHYVLENAAWSPLYIARADTVAKKLTLVTQAKIAQNTGEDWKEVALTLSTSQPSRGGVMPAIEPVFVDILAPVPRSARATAEFAAPPGGGFTETTASASYGYSMPAPAEEMGVESAQIQQLGISMVYQIATPVSVPADEEPHLVNVGQLEAEPKFLLETTPRLQAAAFLKAHIKNTTGAPLLGGEVTIFRDGDMVGKGTLDFVAADEEYDLFLGIDDTMKVEFLELTDKKGQAGLLAKSTVAEKQYQLKLRNFAKDARRVTVIDQVPVAKNDKISVTDKQFTPAPKSVDADSGKITWDIGVAPGAEEKVTNYYKVSWPKDQNVTGL
jgi:uncharacterized protein (TIGR02231 family)